MKKITASRVRVVLWVIAVVATLAVAFHYPVNSVVVAPEKVQTVRDGIVMIRGARNSGSGIVIAPNTVLTARHVVEGSLGGALMVIVNDRPHFVTDVKVHEETDAAVLTVDVACPCWNETVAPNMNEPVFSVGFPFGLLMHTQVVTKGEFQTFTFFEKMRVGVATVAVEPGDSGGGVFVQRNGKFYLVGITIVKVGTSLMFFVPITELNAPGQFTVIE